MASIHPSHPLPPHHKPPDPSSIAPSDVPIAGTSEKSPAETLAPHNEKATRLSFAALLSKPKTTMRFPELSLPSRQYGVKDGVPTVNFSSSEYQAATKRFAFTLIAKFQAGRPTLQEIRKFMIANWALTGKCTITSCWDDRHLIIILDNDEDVRTALTHHQRKVGHALFRLFRWEAGYNPKKEIPKTTKWIRLPGLPIELFDRAIIRSIVSSFADFLDIDDKTKELSALAFARACVEFDVTQPIPNKVWINLPGDKGFYQDVVVEGGTNYCMKCRMHGHDHSTCRKGLKTQQPSAVDHKKSETGKEVIMSEYGPDNLLKATVPKVPETSNAEWKTVTRRKAVRGNRFASDIIKDIAKNTTLIKEPVAPKSHETLSNVDQPSGPIEVVDVPKSPVHARDAEPHGKTTPLDPGSPQKDGNECTILLQRSEPDETNVLLHVTKPQNSNTNQYSLTKSYSLANCKNCSTQGDQASCPPQGESSGQKANLASDPTIPITAAATQPGTSDETTPIVSHV